MRGWLAGMLMTAVAGCAGAPAGAGPAQAPEGTAGQQTATLGGVSFSLWTWQPTKCAPTGVLVVFHGVGRNVAGYRDAAIPLGQRYCMAVVAPLFTEAQFPTWSYQRGGVVHEGRLLPPEQRTVRYAALVAGWARQWLGQQNLPYVFIGHSAGAQFLSRVAAYTDDAARLTVIANPSTWVRARSDIPVPYGFGGLPNGETALRRYLAAPIAVLLGQEDRGSKDLARSDEAEDQGANRYERGQSVFAEAADTARQHGWPFGWRLFVVPGVGHSAGAMFRSAEAFDAVRP